MPTTRSASSRTRSHGSNRLPAVSEVSRGPPAGVDGVLRFQPCAATASTFLYAQGSSVLCLHHETLAVDKRFLRHSEDIVFISVDNVSDRAGRLAVSYDVGQTAIVWDIVTGDELARFVSYEHICVAAWMRNGNVAFGNILGNVILFEPSTSEHISARTIFDPITAIAPAADCQRYAIGYKNGSILIAALQPGFTILHTLNTSRAPSPVVTLAWHGSSSKQKSDMLATQTQDGDLRVWSIAKTPYTESPKVVRVLKRSDNYQPGPNWLAWSKNGRIVQYCEGETSSWDVRTKHVTYEPVPTLDEINALAICGPTATLFTLGRNHSVQQFHLDPPTLIANRQHPPPIPPPSPPVSVESRKSQDSRRSTAAVVSGSSPSKVAPTWSQQTSESEEDTLSPLQKIAQEMNVLEERRQERIGAQSPASSTSRSQQASVSSRSSRGERRWPSLPSHSKVTSRDGTYLSHGSSIHSTRDSLSTSTRVSSPSITSSQRSLPRSSRLRQEVHRSPESSHPAHANLDLFPYTRARLSDVPYRNPQTQDQTQLDPAALRRQMLSVVFGWESDIDTLIQDELQRHAAGSSSAILLSKWLGDVDADMMASMASLETMTASDWMLLALSGFGGQASTKKVGQAYVQRLLEKRDVNAAATILMGLGDHNDAIEIYVSHKYFMEAVLLTSAVYGNDWQRLSGLVRKWGEWAVKHSQQHLAIRCFSCTGIETTAVLTSPRSQDTTIIARTAQAPPSIPQVLSPPLSPPSTKSSRITAKMAELRLITSFNERDGAAAGSHKLSARLFGPSQGDATPMSGTGVTPIAESAISPGGSATWSRVTPFTTRNPDSARTATPGGSRRRLPSIGETPVEATPRAVFNPERLPTPGESGSDLGLKATRAKSGREWGEDTPIILTAARYNPGSKTQSPMTQVSEKILPAPAQDAFTSSKEDARGRNGSRDRKPDGLQIQWPPMEAILTGDYMSPGGSTSKERRSLHARANTEPCMPPSAGSGSLAPHRSPARSGRSIDKYISSLDEANYHAKKRTGESRRRQESRDSKKKGAGDDDTADRGRSQSSRRRARELSEDRGRTKGRYIKPAKRSPSSPVPMSPDDFIFPGAEGGTDESYYTVSSPTAGSTRSAPSKIRPTSSTARPRMHSSGSRTVRHKSQDRKLGSRASSAVGVRVSSRGTSRRRSPSTNVPLDERQGRTQSHGRAAGSTARSPSSPLLLSKAQERGDKESNPQRALSRPRSSSRRTQDRATSARRDETPDRRFPHYRSTSQQARDHSETGAPQAPDTLLQPQDSLLGTETERSGRHQRRMSERSRTREEAAKELEERRRSLARRPSAPPIPTPADILAARSPGAKSPGVRSIGTRSPGARSPVPRSPPPRSPVARSPVAMKGVAPLNTASLPPAPGLVHASNNSMTAPGPANVNVGLPATPRAMRHPKYMSADPREDRDIPAVPDLPQSGSFENTTLSSHYHHGTAQPEPLPASMYAYAARMPLRASSAPIPSEPESPAALPAALPLHPAFQHGLPPSSRQRLSPDSARATANRKINAGEAQPGTLGYEARNQVGGSNRQTLMVSIDETLAAGPQRDTSTDEYSETPQSPMPPVLPELQHLQTPPPPPPPPKARHSHSNSTGTMGWSNSGVINIGIEGDSRDPTPVIDAPIIDAPSPPAPRHVRTRSGADLTSRGRTTADSISKKISRATQRMRSKSGSRSREKSPNPEGYGRESPYESLSALRFRPDVPVRSHTTSPVKVRHPKDIVSGLNLTPAMIQGGFVEGGMI
ncbi:MAG: hypothetical protein M1838_006198 [Thelocarpon superellum]|nr:MAG: hypothetical protein M1838_006198 [Thelocarpon superellum]